MEDPPEDEEKRHAMRRAGQAYLDQIIVKATKGEDPFQQEPLKGREQVSVTIDDPDVAAFGFYFERNKASMLMALFIVSQAASWVLMKGALISMHTPAVMTFLHMLAACIILTAAASYQIVPGPQVTVYSFKGSPVHVTMSALQMLLAMAVLLQSSVYMLLCWIVLVPLACEIAVHLGYKKRQLPGSVKVAAGAAAAGAGLELLADSHRGWWPLVLLLLWSLVVAAGYLWQLLKADATAGQRITEPELLFRIREVSDCEDQTNATTLLLLANILPAVPVLLLGFMFMEGKDLVEHEPSVPALSVMLLSCLVYGGTCLLRISLLQQNTCQNSLTFLTACAALLAVVLDFLERAHTLGIPCLLGVTVAVSGALASHMLLWLQPGWPGCPQQLTLALPGRWVRT